MGPREEFEREHGYWRPEWDAVVSADPALFEAFGRYVRAASAGGALEPSVRELIGIALNAALTHLNAEGVRSHVRKALRLGVTFDEIVETLECASFLSIHTLTFAVPMLVEELLAAGRPNPADRPLTEREAAIKEEFSRVRGFWTPTLDVMVRLDADFFDAYLKYSSIPAQRNALSPKVREFVWIAINVSSTHLYEEGIHVHVRNALAHGATAEELLAVFEQAVLMNIETPALGLSILREEAERLRHEG